MDSGFNMLGQFQGNQQFNFSLQLTQWMKAREPNFTCPVEGHDIFEFMTDDFVNHHYEKW